MFMRRLAALSVAGLFVAMAMMGATSTASAQTAPFTAYGLALTPGATVEARVGGTACSSTTVDASGNWVLYVALTDPCAPKEGSTITFRLDGQNTAQTATFTAGGAPADVANGISLTVVAGGTFTGTIKPGINLVVFSGGSIASAIAAAPNARGFYVTVSGKLVTYVVGAPAFVNAGFNAAFPNGIPASTPMIVLG
jgi:hypothetical protein